MVKSQPPRSLSCSTTSLLIGLAAILCHGCVTDGVRQQAASDRKTQRTEQLLIGAGDADSLAAGAMLSSGPTVNAGRRLTLIAQAVAKAPDRPDLVWLNIQLCIKAEICQVKSQSAI